MKEQEQKIEIILRELGQGYISPDSAEHVILSERDKFATGFDIWSRVNFTWQEWQLHTAKELLDLYKESLTSKAEK